MAAERELTGDFGGQEPGGHAPVANRGRRPGERLIPNRGEFVDALDRLRRGHVIVRISDTAGGCVLDGGIVYSSMTPLLDYALIDEFENPHGFEHARYFRLNSRGHEFAARACAAWKRRPLLERLAIRLIG